MREGGLRIGEVLRRNTQAIVALAGEKSRQARLRVIEAIAEMQHEGIAINFNAICLAARVSKTFLYDPKHSDLAQQIRSFRQTHPRRIAQTIDRSVISFGFLLPLAYREES